MLLLLKLNDINMEYTQDELVTLGLEVAGGQLDAKDIKKWISTHQVD
ncbi:hypothetical protein [Alteribacillus sp. YIM 98480]|nr:hypothetical protein [Alteribacillus sp. YIM 98480]